MTADPQTAPADADGFRQAVEADLLLLVALHAAEPTRAVLAALRECPFQERLGLLMESAAGRASLAVLDAVLAALPAEPGDNDIDALAAGYADVYLNHGYRASPMESVWLDEDGLARQAPMFAVRRWYRHYGLEAGDWAHRPDDHLVLELQFVAHLMRLGALEDAARFLDAHLLRWLPQFAGRLSEMAAPALFAALAEVTAAYAETLREHLAAATGLPRPVADAKADDAVKPQRQPEEAAFLPGLRPGW